MATATTFDQWKEEANQARFETFQELRIQEGGEVAKNFDKVLHEINRVQYFKAFGGPQGGGAGTKTRTQVDIETHHANEQFKGDMLALQNSNDPGKQATAITVKKALNRFSYKTRGPNFLHMLFTEPFTDLDGNFKWQGIAGLVGGGLLGATLLAKSGFGASVGLLQWGGMIAATAVLGAAATPLITSLVNKVMGTTPEKELAPDTAAVFKKSPEETMGNSQDQDKHKKPSKNNKIDDNLKEKTDQELMKIRQKNQYANMGRGAQEIQDNQIDRYGSSMGGNGVARDIQLNQIQGYNSLGGNGDARRIQLQQQQGYFSIGGNGEARRIQRLQLQRQNNHLNGINLSSSEPATDTSNANSRLPNLNGDGSRTV